MSVENGLDELGIGVKGQSNPGIARSPRNSFRASLWRWIAEVEHWKGYVAYKLTDPYQTPNTAYLSQGVRLRGISSVVERETAQTAS